MAGATTRAGEAGASMAEAIIKMVHLYYQNNTALSFLKALVHGLHKEIRRREGGKNELANSNE